MIIKLVWSIEKTQTLSDLVRECLSDLGLLGLVTIEVTDDPSYKMELGITADPALCIEETSIDFKDMIFEGIIPEKSELSSLFVSILGSEDDHEHGGCGTCSSGGWCGTGGGGCCGSGNCA